jgi:hypothetical protein
MPIFFSAAVQLFFYDSALDQIFLWTRNSALGQMPSRYCEDSTQLLGTCSHAHVQVLQPRTFCALTLPLLRIYILTVSNVLSLCYPGVKTLAHMS